MSDHINEIGSSILSATSLLTAEKSMECKLSYNHFDKHNWVKSAQSANSNEKTLKDVDLATAMQITEERKDLMGKRLQLLADSLPKEYIHIQLAYKRKDVNALYELAHRFYGTVCYCAVPKLQQAFYDLRAASKEHSERAIAVSFSQLTEAVESFMEYYSTLNIPQALKDR